MDGTRREAASRSRRKPPRAQNRVNLGTKLVLVAGFGGVLGLMAVAGLDSIRALHQIEDQNARIAHDYLGRHRSLEEIRSALYLSSTFLRDYLTESSPEAAQSSLEGLRRLEDRMDLALRAYSGSVQPEERTLASELAAEVKAYWHTVAPVFRWTPEERRFRGYRFLQSQVLPQRTVVLGIADKISAVNDQVLSDGSRRSTELFVRFRRRVIVILGFTLGIAAVLAVASIIRILRLEQEARVRFEEIRCTQGELKKLSARLVDAQEQERRAISRELHDGIGQSLNALLLDLGNLAALTPPANLEAHRLLDAARDVADSSVKALRNMALLLRPSMLDDFGLVPALHWQAREVSRRTGLRIDVVADEVPEELPDELKTCVYRVVQEALHNCSRHAEARNVRVVVRQRPERILLTIEDDGKGFDAASVRGLGLLGMDERVKHLGGHFDVKSSSGEGTLLRIELPLTTPGVPASQTIL
jgi:signal transduction histidine kinase